MFLKGERESDYEKEYILLLRFQHVENWIATIERSMASTQNTEIPLEQYKVIVNKFKVCMALSEQNYGHL